MVCDCRIKKFPVREECVTTPMSKIHALGEHFIYHRSLRQPAQAEEAVSASCFRPQH